MWTIKKKACHQHVKTNKERGILIGFFLSVVTVLWHLIHCGMPLIMPLLIILNIPMPSFLHFQIPPFFTFLSIIWIIYYVLRKRVIIIWQWSFLKKVKFD